ncbi:hypothetical protein MBLNU459_g2201t1 [Dothideomycetes sp. NU459]
MKSVAEAIAAGGVPSDITAEYLNQSRDSAAITGIIFLLCLTSVVTALRFYSRIFLVKSFGFDDGLAGLGFILFVVFTVLSLILINEGSGRHIEFIQYVLTEPETDQTEIHDYAAHLIYTTALFICRVSGLFFFSRLCQRHQVLITSIRIAGVFLVCCFIPQFVLIMVHCHPVTGLWPYAWQSASANYTCLNWGVVYVTNSSLSLVCDFVIFSIPIAMISLLQLSRERKIMLAIVLLPGTLVIGISVVRLYLCVVGQWASDGSWFYDPQLAIEVSEIGGTLIAMSIPSIKPLIGTMFDRMKSTADRTTGPSQQYGKNGSRHTATAPGSRWQGGDTEVSTNKIVANVTADAKDDERSSQDSDEDLLASMGSRNIFVQRDVALTSLPKAVYRSEGFDEERQASL